MGLTTITGKVGKGNKVVEVDFWSKVVVKKEAALDCIERFIHFISKNIYSGDLVFRISFHLPTLPADALLDAFDVAPA
jgi:hypothetical protein